MKLRLLFFPLLLILASATSNSQAAEDLTQWLPIKALTPGAINPSITQDNIDRTICITGYTKTVRPSASYTTNIKKKQLAETYNRFGAIQTSLFEEDHLIPLELGGNSNNVDNLWPEPWNGTWGAHKKDLLENRLHALVCSKLLDLSTAQHQIADDWISAYKQYFNVASPTPTASPTSNVTQTSASLPTIPPAPTPLIQQSDANDVIITITTLAGFDSASMTLVLSSTSAMGNCPKLLIINTLPFTETCSGLASKQVWVIDTSMKPIAGKSVGNFNFSSPVTFSSFPAFETVPPTPTPTPTFTAAAESPNPTPVASQSNTTVYPGAFCSTAGATGVSAAGKTYTCKTSAMEERLRWRQ